MTIQANPMTLLLETNSTVSAFTAKTPTATEPSGSNVVSVMQDDGRGSSLVEVIPLGTDAADETFSFRIWRWTKTGDDVWVPSLLFEGAVTLGSIDATALGAGLFQADTVSETLGDTANVRTVSPANDVGAYVVADLLGARKIEFDFKKTTAAAMNLLYRLFS